jgi:glucose/arabinose dehydrogenase
MRTGARPPLAFAIVVVALALPSVVGVSDRVSAADIVAGYDERIAIAGLRSPTAARFAPDGSLFVTEQAGRILHFRDLDDPLPTTVADLTTVVNDSGDRGLVGLAVHPEYPTEPYIYVTYTFDAPIGGTAPTWGRAGIPGDVCAEPPAGPGMANGCVASGRLTRLTVGGPGAGKEQVLINDWCVQFESHSVGEVAFGPDGALYVSAGDGAGQSSIDWGQSGSPPNPCDDPPAGVGTPLALPSAEGGSLRAQDLRTPADPVSLDGSVIRIDPATGEALPDNPGSAASDPNARRIIAHGFRNPFRFAFRPGTSELWVGDVGRSSWEEVNRIVDPAAGPVFNGGFPCVEGRVVATDWDTATICADLIATPGAATAPYFAYGHGVPAVAEDTCVIGAGAITGLAFYPAGGTFPSAMEGALFWADVARSCIYVMPPGPDGLPSPTAASVFGRATAPVDLQVSPAGELVYVDVTGSVRVISYHGEAPAPVAQLDADRLSGPVPLTVSLDASASSVSSPDSGPTYSWDLDDDGAFDDGTSPTASWETSDAGRHAVRVRVADGAGNVRVAAAALTAGPVEPAVSDDFESGDLARWELVRGATIEDLGDRGHVLAAVGEGTPAFARLALPRSVEETYVRLRFSVAAQGDHSLYLVRFLGDPEGMLGGVYRNTSGRLAVRAGTDDVSAVSQVELALGAWHEMVVRARVGSAEDGLELWLDGSRIDALSVPLGATTPRIRAIQVGDDVDGRTYELFADTVAAGPNLGPVESPVAEFPLMAPVVVGLAVLFVAGAVYVARRSSGARASDESSG